MSLHPSHIIGPYCPCWCHRCRAIVQATEETMMRFDGGANYEWLCAECGTTLVTLQQPHWMK